MRRLLCGAIAVALLLMTGMARANTIQPILTSVISLGGGLYSYSYNLQLTPNNGLTNGGAIPDDQSGVIILDFGTVSSAVLTPSGGVTSTGDWNLEVANTGGGVWGGPSGPANWEWTAGSPSTFTLHSSGGLKNISADDLSGAGNDNIVVEYTGAGVPVNLTGSNLNLINLTFTSTFVPDVSNPRTSLSRNTSSARPDQLDSFDVATAAPLPATANVGLALLGGIGGIGGLRRLNGRRSVVA